MRTEPKALYRINFWYEYVYLNITTEQVYCVKKAIYMELVM